MQTSRAPSSALSPLSPFVDGDGILRVGGRLARADLPYAIKHPMLLPKDHAVTKMIIRDVHCRNIHAGTQATLNSIRQQFWIPNGKSVIRSILHKCVTCRKVKPRTLNHPMGDLPKVRVAQSRPFLHTGVDYCGPIFIKERVHRN